MDIFQSILPMFILRTLFTGHLRATASEFRKLDIYQTFISKQIRSLDLYCRHAISRISRNVDFIFYHP